MSDYLTDEDDDPDYIENAIETCGIDPRRVLDHPLFVSDDTALDPIERMKSWIKGMDRKAVVASWIKVERELDRTPEQGRDKVIEMLHDRLDYLDQHGQRPDLTTASLDERPARFLPSDRQTPPKDWYWVRPAWAGEPERRPWADRSTTATEYSHPYDWGPDTAASAETTVATDGGEEVDHA